MTKLFTFITLTLPTVPTFQLCSFEIEIQFQIIFNVVMLDFSI